MLSTRRELPDEPRVDRPECESVALLLGSLENPLELRCREVRVGHQACAATNEVSWKLPTTLGRSAILPDDCRVHGTPAALVPEERRLALVRDPDCHESSRADTRAGEGLLGCREDALPDLVRVVLDPSCPREVLVDFAIAATEDAQLLVHDERCRTRCSLVDRQDHGGSMPQASTATSECSNPLATRRRCRSGAVKFGAFQKEFTEPVALLSTQLTGLPLPRRAFKLSFDLLALRARCEEEPIVRSRERQGRWVVDCCTLRCFSRDYLPE